MRKRFVTTSFGEIAYSELGDPAASPLLFVHGIPTSSYLWRDVMGPISEHYLCYAPDLMGLGDTEVSVDAEHFHMDGQAEMLVEFMAELGHERFGLVCHDQGGAAAQVIVERFPERVECFVITNCVCYDNWPVPLIRRLQQFSRIPILPGLLTASGIGEWLETGKKRSSFRRGVLDPTKLTDEAIREYLRPMRSGKVGRDRFDKFLQAGDSKYTERAVAGLRRFHRPTLVVWAEDDAFLSQRWGRRLYDDIPGAKQFELVPDCGHFWQEERPEAFVPIIRDFLHAYLEPSVAGRKVHLPMAN